MLVVMACFRAPTWHFPKGNWGNREYS